jgi:hypothetical protein
MRAADPWTRVGTFALVAVLVAGAVVGASMLGGGNGDGFTASSLSVEGHQSPAIANQPTEAGSISLSADTAPKVVVIDDAHNNDVDETQLRPLVNALTSAGHTIRFYRPDRGASGQALNESLGSADAFVSVAPQQRFGSGEADALAAFTNAGGRVVVAAEPEQRNTASSLLGLTSRGSSATMAEVAPVLSQYRSTAGSGYLFDLTENVNNHANLPVTPTGEAALTDGVDRVVVSAATPVTGPNVLLETKATAELSTTRDDGRYGVLARSGNVAVLGDASLLDPDWAYVADNEVLIGNLADFLVSGDRTPTP